MERRYLLLGDATGVVTAPGLAVDGSYGQFQVDPSLPVGSTVASPFSGLSSGGTSTSQSDLSPQVQAGLFNLGSTALNIGGALGLRALGVSPAPSSSVIQPSSSVIQRTAAPATNWTPILLVGGALAAAFFFFRKGR